MYNKKHLSIALVISVICIAFGAIAAPPKEAAKEAPKETARISEKNKKCIDCHLSNGMGVGQVNDWKASKHGQKGIGCIECHEADKKDADAFDHEGYVIATIVSPKDCSRCHIAEGAEFQGSHHAKGAQFIGSLDNVLGNVIEGPAAADLGCRQCHGSEVKVLPSGRLDPATWPNTGIGRINPDGSKGSCSACHARHGFSIAQVRQPENCGKCHMGPDHPQLEIYNESKHGILFNSTRHTLDLSAPKDKWKAGVDYLYPTCATCHMSATTNQGVTHDAGKRISWTLRPAISVKLSDWEQRRAAMKDVCKACHATGYIDNFYIQYDSAVNLYNKKFAEVAADAMKKLRDRGKLTATPFDEKIEWTYYELWHHEGRRARMGASMNGPDFTQWHGFYEVAKSFYTKFIPELRELAPELADEILSSPEHGWTKGLSKEDVKKTLEYYKERYKQ